ncbi:hypothetical protein [Motiliproteus sp. SC1-56]|uniref:hypothetical protein n=1 Tax=Motiliproteus sp. SC1-56 TaxID=2799565 RepID=UPI001A8E8662|nr:hypothetical protein [Motiliproteus sp. SC1-56]
MYQATVTNVPLYTEGYYFSPHLFDSDTIDAVQLAVMLGTNNDGEPEVILVAVPDRQSPPYQLAIAGKLDVLDARGRPVPPETLKTLPVGEINEATLRRRGWSVRSRPYFVWQKQNEPVAETRSKTIYASVHHQLKTLSAVM